MELIVFARFHARDGEAESVASAMRDSVLASRREPGCVAIDGYRSTRDARLFYIHSRWVDEAAFDLHAAMPHTVRFLERVQPLIDHPLDVTRSRAVDWSQV
ncbi:MAG: antibiotic biosynthesis monooxygenase [Alphaproteobacteria bacterium]|nr:antibiotic biosynthesis monooxygenase [Alphaproteobacteria bacterium]